MFRVAFLSAGWMPGQCVFCAASRCPGLPKLQLNPAFASMAICGTRVRVFAVHTASWCPEFTQCLWSFGLHLPACWFGPQGCRSTRQAVSAVCTIGTGLTPTLLPIVPVRSGEPLVVACVECALVRPACHLTVPALPETCCSFCVAGLSGCVCKRGSWRCTDHTPFSELSVVSGIEYCL
ncbi:unnamed protein product [Effrenium voratum]|uniref:Secreted protein n=2 Tax=Effrenium voratum TaxID=2562239 RepID=A0AA36I0M0_9DINO|nr:unnamed protein product [Effrenium voratum]